MALLLQKEVAERICTPAPDMSILAFSVQFYGTPQLVQIVKKEDFWPVPKVDSAVVKIVTLPPATLKQRLDRAGCDEPMLFRLVKFGFSSKRKQLHKNLAAGLQSFRHQEVTSEFLKNRLVQAGIHPQARAENLSLDQWLDLARLLGPSLTP